MFLLDYYQLYVYNPYKVLCTFAYNKARYAITGTSRGMFGGSLLMLDVSVDLMTLGLKTLFFEFKNPIEMVDVLVIHRVS